MTQYFQDGEHDISENDIFELHSNGPEYYAAMSVLGNDTEYCDYKYDKRTGIYHYLIEVAETNLELRKKWINKLGVGDPLIVRQYVDGEMLVMNSSGRNLGSIPSSPTMGLSGFIEIGYEIRNIAVSRVVPQSVRGQNADGPSLLISVDVVPPKGFRMNKSPVDTGNLTNNKKRVSSTNKKANVDSKRSETPINKREKIQPANDASLENTNAGETLGDVDFLEEKENYIRLDKRISMILSDSDTELERLVKELNAFVVVDYIDQEKFLDMSRERERQSETVTKYRNIISSPYFGRFDLASLNDDRQYTYLIGNTELLDPKNYDALIIDWRSPIANCFYNKSERHFTVNKIDYDLLLRRTVNIQNRTLVSVKTEYDTALVSLDGEVVDEFLLSVLRDKRRNHRLTDIIRTIQDNQNSIIRKPIDESFVVQGCAGSGKTMILLHRLSYIAFNYNNINYEHVMILTPNENFNLHVDQLSKELGLNKIQKKTVESYYMELINTLSRQDMVVKSRRKTPKITIPQEKVRTEKMLNRDLLSIVYSESFYERLMDDYHIASEAIVRRIEQLQVLTVLDNYGIDIDEIEEMNYKVFRSLGNALEKASRYYDEHINDANNKEELLSEITRQIDKLLKTLPQKEAKLIESCEAVFDLCQQRIQELGADVDALNVRIGNQQKLIHSQEEEKKQLMESVRINEKYLEDIIDHSKSINDYDYLVSSSDEIALLVKESMEPRFVEIDELNTKLRSLPFYNFGKKSRIKKEIREKKIYLSGVIDKYIEDYCLYLKNGIDELKMQIAPIEEKIKIAEGTISKDKKAIETLSGIKDRYSKCNMYLANEPYPDLNVLLNDDGKQDIGEELKDYKRLRNAYYKSSNEIVALEQTRNNLSIEIEEFAKRLPNEKDIQIINDTKELIGSFDALNVYKIWEKRLRTLYKQYEQPYSTKANYRHKLYLKLLFCEKYYGLSNNSTYYINIDEAQDLAPVEYKLLQRVLGSKTVFNLYGDVNQAVYDYKGISDWEEIREVTDGNVYLLNENYRNTLQITEYCNEVFDASVTAIGLMGDEVTHLNFEDALHEIERIHKKNPDYRTAIIYRRGLDGLQERIRQAKLDCVYNEVDSSSISVITVEEAKGLEFEVVLAVDNYMTENELYISYTRALDTLIITSLPDSSFAVDVDEEDNGIE